MVTNYQRGYSLEKRTTKTLEKHGWLCMRSPASKTAVDILAVKDDYKLLIQCKKTTKEKTYITGLGDLIKKAKKHSAIPLLVYSFTRMPPFVLEVKKPSIKLERINKHVKLDKYLETLEAGNYENLIIGGE